MGGHVYNKGGHVYNKGGHVYNKGGHVYNKGGHMGPPLQGNRLPISFRPIVRLA